jgi:hypothetical protein
MGTKRTFDSAMELEAVKAGLVSEPVFEENRQLLNKLKDSALLSSAPVPEEARSSNGKWVNRNGFNMWVDPNHREGTVVPEPVYKSDTKWGEPPPKKNTSLPIYQLVMADVMARTDFGIKKYGTPLQANNGRNALKDAYEEALDLCMYLRQLLEERK